MKIDSPPMHGVHTWCLTAARQCQLQGVDPAHAHSLISAFEPQLRRKFQPNEVRNAVEKAYSTTLPPRPEDAKFQKPLPKPAKASKPKTSWDESRTNIMAKVHQVQPIDIWEASPVMIDDGFTQDFCLNALFPDPDGLICVGKSAMHFHTARIKDFRNLMDVAFIVPCYMTSKYGTTQAGKRSMHALDNCGPRRFCVCDFDEPSSDHHASIVWHLKQTYDLVMVLSSGGKSLHSWFNVPEDEEERFWKTAIPLGADPALMRNRSSFVRMPLGMRDNGARQGVFYFDPTAITEDRS
jgi:hypothetical protein